VANAVQKDQFTLGFFGGMIGVFRLDKFAVFALQSNFNDGLARLC
jgi:hypothetical protein